MHQVKITVLKRSFNEELVKEYGLPGFGVCEALKEGQEFLTYFEKPEGFCDEAWKAIYQYVFALCHGADGWYGRSWINGDDHPYTAIVSCNDGLRPVIFKLERVD